MSTWLPGRKKETDNAFALAMLLRVRWATGSYVVVAPNRVSDAATGGGGAATLGSGACTVGDAASTLGSGAATIGSGPGSSGGTTPLFASISVVVILFGVKMALRLSMVSSCACVLSGVMS